MKRLNYIKILNWLIKMENLLEDILLLKPEKKL
jgi:hypothetical protein